MHTLMMTFNLFVNAERPLCAADVQVRLPMPYSNPHALIAELERQGCVVAMYRVGNERYCAYVADAPPPVIPDVLRTAAATAAALRVRKKHRFAMLAREARRRG